MTSGDPAPTQYSIVCLSTQEWHAPLPTNRQQIMTRIARRGRAVLFVETGGWLGRDLRQLFLGPGRRSLLRRLVGGEEVAPSITVRKLWAVAPFGQRLAVANRLNWRCSAGHIRRGALALPEPRVTWLYDPKAVWAVGRFGDTFAVYDVVDDYPEQAARSNGSKRAVAAADHEAAARARLVFATTEPLRARHDATNVRTHLVPNVGDFDHFSIAADRSVAQADLLTLPRPVLGFAGNLTREKVDFDLLETLADAFAEGTLVLVGPAEPAAVERVKRLAARPNVRWLGWRPYAELPEVVAAFDVALIPYRLNEYTRSCFPLKSFEYLAAGKPVIATGLPQLHGLAPHVVVAPDAEAAVGAVADALRHGGGPEERQAVAARHTWESRTSRLLELIEHELAGA